ncbi:MAG: cupin domain-containing protein [Psychrosphaera sp.]|nr:cupin domain-containing protein [Psychrosphaera sp.]
MIDTYETANPQLPPAQAVAATIGMDTFCQKYWEQKPFLIKHPNPDYYQSTVDLASFSNIANFRFLAQGDIRIFNHFKSVPFDSFSQGLPIPYKGHRVANMPKVLELYEQGNTVILQNIHRYEPSFGRLARQFEKQMNMRTNMHVYITPKENTGFNAHWDHMCAFIMQVKGSKIWEIYEKGVNYPSPVMGPNPKQNRKPAQIAKIKLVAGDLLYLPRGMVHSPYCESEDSIHINLSLKPISNENIINEMIGNMIANQPFMRKGLDGGDAEQLDALKQLLCERINQFDMQALEKQLRTKMIVESNPIVSDGFDVFSNRATLNPDSVLAVSQDVLWCYETNGKNIELVVSGSRSTLQENYLAAIEFVMANQHESFKLAHLPMLDDQSQLDFALTLMKLGLLVAAG